MEALSWSTPSKMVEKSSGLSDAFGSWVPDFSSLEEYLHGSAWQR